MSSSILSRQASRRSSPWLRRRYGLLVRATLLAVATAGAAADEPSPLEQFPGRMVDIGTHALHLDCRGRGQPTIVLESGIGGFSLEWAAVRSALAPHSRVCAYDRAGYGWSEPGPLPRNASRAADELSALLETAGERAPYVLAGHSFGGYIVRLFAERHPERVAGLVLIDAAAPEQFSRLPEGALPRACALAMAEGRQVFSMPRLATGVPEHSRTLGLQLMMLPKARRAYASEISSFEASARTVSTQVDGLFTVPLVVLSRAREQFDDSAGGRAAERVWREMQIRMRGLSARSDHWIAGGAGHLIHADRPDLVALALDEVRLSNAFSPAAPDSAQSVRIVSAVHEPPSPLPSPGL